MEKLLIDLITAHINNDANKFYEVSVEVSNKFMEMGRDDLADYVQSLLHPERNLIPM